MTSETNWGPGFIKAHLELRDKERAEAASPVQGAASAPGCPNAAHMGEHACANRSQCWEPCGELGKSAEHCKVAAASAPPIYPYDKGIAASATDQGAAVKPWEERYESPVVYDSINVLAAQARARDEELAELRAALAERAQAQPSVAALALIEAVRMDIIGFLRASNDNDCANRVEEFMTTEAIAKNIGTATHAPEQEAAPDDTAAELKRLHDALCFWLPQNRGELPEAMRERIAADAYLLVGYDDMPDKQSAEELGWISAGIKAAQGVEADDSDLYKKISSVLLENTKMRGHTIGMVANQLLPLFRAAPVEQEAAQVGAKAAHMQIKEGRCVKFWYEGALPDGFYALAAESSVMRPFGAPAGQHDAWIAVEDQSPPRNGRVLVVGGDVGTGPETAWVDADGKISLEIYDDRRISSDPSDNPSHWMPLPPPPEQSAASGSREGRDALNKSSGKGCATATNTNQPEGAAGEQA